MRLSKSEVEPFQSNTGEVDCLKWKNVVFTWTGNTNSVDEYTAEGVFVGLNPNQMYEKLVIMADFAHGTFHLRTGKGKKITWINLLGL